MRMGFNNFSADEVINKLEQKELEKYLNILEKKSKKYYFKKIVKKKKQKNSTQKILVRIINKTKKKKGKFTMQLKFFKH